MNRRAQHSLSTERRGMKRSTRMSMIAGVTVFLSLISGVSFATWTASSTKTATATVGNIAVSTPVSGTGAIAELGPFTYTAKDQTLIKPITVRNTGTVDATVSTIAISRSGSLGGAQIAVKFWLGVSAACTASTPVVSTTLNGGTVSLSDLNMTVAATKSAILCASTTFTGIMKNQAGKTTDVAFALNTSAGANWNATDSVGAASRTFTQKIFITTPPNAPIETECVNGNSENVITISWSTPSGFVAPNGGYNVYWEGGYVANTSANSIALQGSGETGGLTIRAVASDGTESIDSSTIPVVPRYRRGNQGMGIACG